MNKKLILDWDIRLTKAQVGHYIAAERYLFYHSLVGIILVISSTFVSSSLFLDTKIGLLKNSIITASVVSTILAGIQTLIRPSEQAEIHRSKAVKYGMLRRKMELFSATPKTDDLEENFLLELRTEWDNIADNAPITPRRLRQTAAKVLSQDFTENTDLNSIKNK